MKTAQSNNIVRRTIGRFDHWLQRQGAARHRGTVQLDQHTLRDIGISHAQIKLMESGPTRNHCQQC
jgi:uncharacterized protein YjiS (DUF1127 family)